MKTFVLCYKMNDNDIPFTESKSGQLYCFSTFAKAAQHIKAIVEHFEWLLKGEQVSMGLFKPVERIPPSELERLQWTAMRDTIFVKEVEI